MIMIIVTIRITQTMTITLLPNITSIVIISFIISNATIDTNRSTAPSPQRWTPLSSTALRSSPATTRTHLRGTQQICDFGIVGRWNVVLTSTPTPS